MELAKTGGMHPMTSSDKLMTPTGICVNGNRLCVYYSCHNF